MSEIIAQSEIRFRFLKGFIGAFRLMHFLPVATTTTIGTFIAVLALKGSNTFTEFFQNISSGIIKIAPLIFFILTIFFQEAFCGVQNDYLDREIDAKYNKSKAIPDGWVSASFAFWFSITCFVLFTGFSFGVGVWAIRSYWVVLFVQGANFIGIFYNLYAKHRPISILPYIIGFPLIPTFVWLTFGGFELKFLWMIPVLMFVSLPAHIANELPDFDLDVKYNHQNFAIFLGKKNSTIVYWIGIILIEIIILTVYLIYDFNKWILLVTILLSMLIGIGTFLLLWRKKWETDVSIFNLVTLCIGVEVLGFFILFGI